MTPRVLVAVLFVAAVSVLSVGRFFLQVAEFYPSAPARDGITDFTDRFAALRAALPPKGVIGYLTDPGMPPNDPNVLAEFRLTQYALAPILVVDSPNQRFLVGNFHKEITTGSLRDRGFKLVRLFGNGIALVENESVVR